MTDESARNKFVLFTIVLAVAADTVMKSLGLGWAGAAIITFAIDAAILAFVIVRRDRLMGQLFVFGLVAGFAELPSDHFSTSIIRTLVYAKGGVFIWTSPLYMPFAYIVVIVQLGYLAYWMTRRWGLVTATIVSAVIGGINVPTYEYLAKGAHEWYYQNCNMLFGTVPYYIILGEALFVGALPLMTSRFPRASWPTVVGLGLLEGLVMYIGWRGSYWLTG